MKKIAFTLEHFGDMVGIIILDEKNDDIMPKLESAVRDNLELDTDTTVHISIGRTNNYGENTKIVVKYVSYGEMITDDGFVLRKKIMLY
jgi:hypothetical protein